MQKTRNHITVILPKILKQTAQLMFFSALLASALIGYNYRLGQIELNYQEEIGSMSARMDKVESFIGFYEGNQADRGIR